MADHNVDVQAHRVAVLDKARVRFEFATQSAQCIGKEKGCYHKQEISAVLEVELQVQLLSRVRSVTERHAQVVPLVADN